MSAPTRHLDAPWIDTSARFACVGSHILSRDCLLAAVGRIFVHSGRKVGTSEENGACVLTQHNDENPHDLRNEVHIFEFVEAVCRVANKRYRTKADTVNKQLAMFISE